MQLIKQEKLHFKDSKSDKIYEVELYHIQQNEYVVNFRYGRRGSSLREGTKTVFPVQKEQAEQVFIELVESKTKKGYQRVQSYDDTPVIQPTPAKKVHNIARSTVLSYLARRAKGDILTTNWKLSRIIWRAGEMQIEEAIPHIKELIPTLSEQELYSAVWALGKIRTKACADILADIPTASVDLYSRIRRAALVALGSNDAFDNAISELPKPIRAAIVAKNFEAVLAELKISLINNSFTPDSLLAYYYVVVKYAEFRKPFSDLLADVAIVPGIWKPLRYIYKIAEMLDDGYTFGMIARLVNLKPSYYRKNRWSEMVYVNGQTIKVESEIQKDNPKIAFSNKTKDYFVKRTLRRLRKAGIDKMESYCKLAAGILIAHRAEDEIDHYNQISYSYDSEARSYNRSTRVYPKMAHVPYFYYILHAQNDRLKIGKKTSMFYGVEELKDWSQREDSFPDLWNSYPQYGVDILAESRQKDAMQFGFKILKGRPDLESLLTMEKLLLMLSSPFAEVLEFSLDYIKQKYDKVNPDVSVIIKLIETKNEKAVQTALELINENSKPFEDHVAFMKSALLSEYEPLHIWLRANIKEEKIPKEEVEGIVNFCLEEYVSWEEDTFNSFSAESLVQLFPEYLKELDADRILNLLEQPQLQVQLLGAKLINLNSRKPEEWPSEVLMKLLTSPHEVIRQEGVKLLSRLTDQQLAEKSELIVKLASSEHQDLRINARAIIKRIVPSNKKFAEEVLFGLYDVLLDPHEDDELPIDVYDTIEMYLLEAIEVLVPELETMLESSQREIQLLTSYLIENQVDINTWEVGRIAKLGRHDMKNIRNKAEHYFNANIPKIKYEKYEAIAILDSDWQDIRDFGKSFFDEHFGEREWDPELIIALCDNVRPETQEYGTRVLGKYFKDDHGAKYLTALSEHPDPIIELYSTNYLETYAKDNMDILNKLKPYFTRSLGSINTRRVAKKRVFRFLENQAKESLEYARFVTDILNELVGTIIVRENEDYVGLLYELQGLYPELDTNIEKVPIEIR